jgi:sugar phosphate isomerase/epimerase
LEHRVHSTHVHDNKGDRDAHLWPGEGTINWNDTMQALRAAPLAPALLLEIEGEDGVDVAARMADAYKKLETAAAATE